MSSQSISENATTGSRDFSEVAPTISLKLPKVGEPAAISQARNAPEDLRNPMFELLVQNESDISGLLAYALYKQNKRDWLIAFQAAHGRMPDSAEAEAFILGERIPRRTATYRKLAEDMLQRGEARTSLLGGLITPPANDVAGQYPMHPQQKKPLTWRYVGFLLIMLVAMAVAFRLAGAWLFGTPGR